MPARGIGFAVILGAIILTAGCNIFEFAASSGTAEDYVADGMQNLWDGKYAEAEADFSKALEKEPGNAEALWGRAKARLRGTGFTSITLLSELSNLEPQEGGVVPFMNEVEWPIEDLDRLYTALQGVRHDITPLYREEVPTTEYTQDGVELDYAAVLSVLGVLTLRDTDGSGSITETDVNLHAAFAPGGHLVVAWGDLDEADRAAVIARVAGLLEEGSDVIEGILEDLEPEGVDLDAVNETIDELARDLRTQEGK